MTFGKGIAITTARDDGKGGRHSSQMGKGYAPGQMSLNSDMQAPRQPGASIETTYTVTNADAHSWAEVYFGEYGWIPVEATPDSICLY